MCTLTISLNMVVPTTHVLLKYEYFASLRFENPLATYQIVLPVFNPHAVKNTLQSYNIFIFPFSV